MHPAARLQFERMIGEFLRWRAVPEKERSLAPAWWWGPALELRDAPEPMPVESCADLGLSDNSTYAAGAHVFLTSMADQTFQPWPYDFPRRMGIPDPAVRELHPQPSDDSAFTP